MKRTTVFSVVLVLTCTFVGSFLKVEAARFSAGRGLGEAQVQAVDTASADADVTWASFTIN